MRILLVASSKDLSTLALIVRRYRSLIPDIEIVICSPSRLAVQEKLGRFNDDVKIVQDNEIEDFESVNAWLQLHEGKVRKKGRSRGWYLQQYIKVAYAWRANDDVFINDADTIFSHTLLRTMTKTPFLLSTKEDIERYTMAQQMMNLPTAGISYISNGGFFCRTVFRDIGASPSDWFIGFLEKILDEDNFSDFSEYQIVGSLQSGEYRTSPLRIFRRFDLLLPNRDLEECSELVEGKLNSALKYYDAVAIEKGHKRSFKSCLLAQFAYVFRYSW